MTVSGKNSRSSTFQALSLLVLMSAVFTGFLVRSQHIQGCKLIISGLELLMPVHDVNCFADDPQPHEGQKCCFDDDCHSSFLELSLAPVTRYLDIPEAFTLSGFSSVPSGYSSALIRPPISLFS